MKKLLILTAASLVPLAATANTASAVTLVDAGVYAYSTVPVPGGATAGSWGAGSATQYADVLPAGTTFIAKFERLDGAPARGVMTFTLEADNPAQATVQRIDRNVFRITTGGPMGGTAQIRGFWSDSHWFYLGDRDKLTISVESLPTGYSDRRADNDVTVYDNHGKGF